MQPCTTDAAAGGSALARTRRAAGYFLVPARLGIETMQIVASFPRTMPLTAWPRIFNVIARQCVAALAPWPPLTLPFRLFAFFDFDFTQLPSTACGTPKASFDTLFNGVTIGVALFLLYCAALWFAGRSALRALRGPRSAAAFDRLSCNRLCFFLLVVHAPVSQITLRIAQCRAVGAASYLWADTSIQCTGTDTGFYAGLRGAGGLWTTVYVVGIPALFAALLFHYRVPHVARERTADARLAALLTEAARRRLALPEPPPSPHATVSASLGLSTLDALYAEFIAPPGDPSAADERDVEGRREQLLAYSRAHLPLPPVLWADDDPRLDGARAAIGCLFASFHADCWYWCLVEAFFKLMVSAVLGFIATGREAQPAAAMLFSFLMLLAFQRAAPYTDKAARRTAHAALIELFVLYTFALLLRAQVDITADNARFYSAAMGLLVVCVFVLPIAFTAQRLSGLRFDAELEAEGEEEEEEEPEKLPAKPLQPGCFARPPPERISPAPGSARRARQLTPEFVPYPAEEEEEEASEEEDGEVRRRAQAATRGARMWEQTRIDNSAAAAVAVSRRAADEEVARAAAPRASPAAAAAQGEAGNPFNPPPPPAAAAAGTPASPGVASRLAAYDFEATQAGELSFREGDVIVVTNTKPAGEEGGGWWEGRNARSGETGAFPVNYTTEQQPSWAGSGGQGSGKAGRPRRTLW